MLQGDSVVYGRAADIMMALRYDFQQEKNFSNKYPCRAIMNFNMIDTMSRGIKKMFNELWKRHFPMPDYEIDAL